MNNELTWNQRWQRMKSALLLTNKKIAAIIGMTEASIRTMTQPSAKFPRWAKLAIYVYETLALK